MDLRNIGFVGHIPTTFAREVLESNENVSLVYLGQKEDEEDRPFALMTEAVRHEVESNMLHVPTSYSNLMPHIAQSKNKPERIVCPKRRKRRRRMQKRSRKFNRQ